MPSMRMGLQAINQTRGLAEVISRPRGKVSASVADPSSWFLNPVWPCLNHLVSLRNDPRVSVSSFNTPLFFDATHCLSPSFPSSETEKGREKEKERDRERETERVRVRLHPASINSSVFSCA